MGLEVDGGKEVVGFGEEGVDGFAGEEVGDDEVAVAVVRVKLVGGEAEGIT